MMNRAMADSILELKEYNRYMKGIFSFVGFDTKWIPFHNVERTAGETKWSLRSLFRYAMDGILSFSSAPVTMAGAAADTLYKYLTETNTKPSDYDLILTGDLGKYGKEILKDLMLNEYNIDLSLNYNDCGTMLYDLEEQKEVMAGGSGPVCSALVNYSTIIKGLMENKYKKVLLIATGALFSPIMLYQKENILSIANLICLEAI